MGKSSLLNLLAGAEGLARVSNAPGFTRLINIFTVNKSWRLVDLPGYGFAQGARKDRARFNKAVSQYLEHRTNLCLVFVLLDPGLPPQQIDLQFIEWLVRRAVPFVLVFTKIDKVSDAVGQTNIAALTESISMWFEKPPAIFTCSAKTGAGRADLLSIIDEQMKAIVAASAETFCEHEGSGKTTRVREGNKPRPDRHRPW